MFCPLCKAEYREPFTRCADCDVDLVASLDLPENSLKVLWTGRDEALFDQILSALRDAGIPYAGKNPPRTFMARRFLRKAEIRVRSTDLEAAHRAAAAAVQNPDLFESHRELVCPLCAAEFSKDATECSECGVPLISWEEAQEPIDAELAMEPLDVIWQGSDPVAVSKVLAELRAEGIAHQAASTHDHLAFELALPRPRYRVTVFQSDSEKAWNLIAAIPQSFAFALSTPEQRLLEDEALSADPGSAPASLPRRVWKPQEATVEIWSGDDTAVARVIENCFAENDLPCREKDNKSGPIRIFVRPEDADRAREILREITDGTPPS